MIAESCSPPRIRRDIDVEQGHIGPGHEALCLLNSTTPATIMTTTIRTPCTTWAVFGSIPMALKIGERVNKMIPAAAAPTTDPIPPVRATPPNTIAATERRVKIEPVLQRVTPRTR